MVDFLWVFYGIYKLLGLLLFVIELLVNVFLNFIGDSSFLSTHFIELSLTYDFFTETILFDVYYYSF